MRSVSVGFWVSVGGRHESSALNGMSHFVEHLLFKGTKKRSARQITEAVEGVGGFINAFTSEDHTCYYAKAAANYLPLLCEVLADMFLHSEFAASEIERERDVIREEIMMYRDQPSQQAQEILMELMWPRHALGRPLTGTVGSLATFDREAVLDFVRSHYHGGTLLVTVAGNAQHDEVMQIIEPLLATLPRKKAAVAKLWNAKNWHAQVRVATEDTEQAHLCLACHTISRNDERRFALKILNVILGENMSSRLFQELREKHAYCYSVQAETLTLADTGIVNISAGLDSEKLRPALRLILREFDRVIHKPVSAKELKQAKDYTIGHNDLSLESTTHQMMWIGESILAYDRIVEPFEIQARLRAVTAVEVQEVAQLTFVPEKMALAVVGKGLQQAAVEGWVAGGNVS